MLNPRTWIGYDAVAVAWDEPGGTIAVLRDPVTTGITGRGWVDRPGQPGRYECVPADVVAYCRDRHPSRPDLAGARGAR